MEVPVSFPVLVACVVLFGAGCAAEKESKDPLVRAFNSLKPEEKPNFIAYFLALGLKDWADQQPRSPKFYPVKGNIIKDLNIPSENLEKFEKMDIPKDSRLRLLNWTKNEFNLTTKNVLEMLRSKKGSATTRFVDIGELCCPW